MKVQDDGRGMKKVSIGKRQKSGKLSHRPEISSFDPTKSVTLSSFVNAIRRDLPVSSLF